MGGLGRSGNREGEGAGLRRQKEDERKRTEDKLLGGR